MFDFSQINDYAAIKKLADSHKVTYWGTKFNFLKSSNGLRPQCLHVFLAPPSAGKTTMQASIVHDALKESKVVVILTEETADEYLQKLYFYGSFDAQNLKIVETKKFPKSIINVRGLAVYLDALFKTESPALFVLDNLTTEKIYTSSKSTEQANFVDFMADTVKKYKMALAVFCHTDGGFNRNVLLKGEAVKFSKHIYNRAEYFYTIQIVDTKAGGKTILQILKNRFHGGINKFYMLNYDQGKYISDRPINGEVIVNTLRERLGG